jgi:hypothetical protein
VEARSFNYVFFSAIVLEVLTVAAVALKTAIVRHFRPQDSRRAVALMAFGVWLVMFSSKFVFIWAIDLVFGNEVNINGFFGIFLVALLATVAHRPAVWLFVRLGPTSRTDPAMR